MSQYCPICDSVAELVREDREIQLGRRTVVVEHQLYRCRECEESWYTAAQMDTVQKLAARKIREEEDLLSPDEIHGIRDALELSQADFERLLGFGPKTVGRWERGTVFQNRSSDVLMRVVRRFPEVARFLAEEHDVELPGDGDWGSTASEKTVSEPGISEAHAFRSTGAVPKDMHEIFRPTHSGFSPLVLQVTRAEDAQVQETSEVS